LLLLLLLLLLARKRAHEFLPSRHQAEFGVMYVRIDAHLRRILDEEDLRRFYRYEVELADREFPDIKGMFFSEQKADDEDEDR
jgi:hypothetical protein